MQTRLLKELRRMNRKLDLVIERLDIIEAEGVIEMAWIDDMRAELANNTSVSQSAVVAVNTLADKVQALINSGADPDELQELCGYAARQRCGGLRRHQGPHRGGQRAGPGAGRAAGAAWS